MERLPHRVKIERTPQQQAERVARDEAIRKIGGNNGLESVTGEGPEISRTELRRKAGPPDWPAKKFVAALRAKRQRLGLSLADVADRMGADRGAIHKIEIGLNRNPTFDTLVRYAAALGMNFNLHDVDDSTKGDTRPPLLPSKPVQKKSRSIETG